MRIVLGRWKFRLWFVGGMAFTSLGCHSGGGITASPPVEMSSEVKLDTPTISSPSSNPYYSKSNSVTITGMCSSGAEVLLSGSDTQKATCQNQQFSFIVSKNTDGIYTFNINQKDPVQGLSVPAQFVWIRKNSVAPPSLTQPTSSDFASAQASLQIVGSCESGSLISLSGDGVGYTTCLNSSFTLSLPKAVDGDYQITINLTDLAGNEASTNLIWRKHALALTPGNATVVVNTNYNFTVSGGSGNYTVTLTQNNSGGNFDSLTNTYTSGTVSGVIDVIRVLDSLGSVLDFQLTTVASMPDHIMLVSNSNPPAERPGTTPSEKVQVRLVDAYGNGIANYPLVFKLLNGSVEIIGFPLQVTDLNGQAEVSIRHGFSSTSSTISIGPTVGVLPDLANTGNAVAKVTLLTEPNNGGNWGAIYSLGNSPGKMVSGDFNGDGFNDVAVLNVGDKTVGVLNGNASGMFSEMTPMATANCEGASSIATGNLNSDSILDLVITCSGNDKFVVLIGNGNGTFATPMEIFTPPTQGTPVAVVVVDWNNDADQDLVLLSRQGDVAAVWLGDGTGNFTSTIEIVVGASPNALEVVDINKDSLLDIVVLNSGINPLTDGNVGVIRQTSPNVFSPMTTYPVDATPVDLKMADLDQDGYKDVVVCNNGGNNLTVWINDQNGGLTNSSSLTVGSAPSGLFVGDVDDDGKQDLLIVNTDDNSLSVILNQGGGNWDTSVSPMSVIATPINIVGGDFNGDHISDLIINSGNQLLQMIPGKHLAGLGYTAPTGLTPTKLVTGDWDGDGTMGLAVLSTGGNGEISILRGNGRGLFTAGTPISNVLNPKDIISGDWNFDGKADLAVVLGGSSIVRIYLGKGDRTFESPLEYPVGSGPISVVSADLNDDGNNDLIVANQTSNSITILLGVGDGTFGSRSDIPIGNSPMAVAFGDINKDNKIDLVVAQESSASVAVLLGNGGGSFQTPSTVTVGNGPNSLLLQDFNGDGSLDLATLNGFDGTVSVLLGTGDGSFQAKNDFTCGITPVGLVAGDFDGNGRLDVAVTNSSDQKLTILYNMGGGNLTNQYVIETNAALGGLGLSDLNGDGALDFILTEVNNNQIQVWVGY